MLRQIPRLLCRLSLLSLSLSACAKPLVQPMAAYNFYSASDYYSAFNDSRFSVQWSPDGTRVAIRSQAPTMQLAGSKNLSPYPDPQDVIQVFDASNGQRIAVWAPDTPIAAASSLAEFRKSRELNLQWSTDSRKLFVLEQKTEQNLLQGLVLYTFDTQAIPKAQAYPEYDAAKNYSVRDVVFPESMRNSQTLSLEKPSLNPEGTKIALYRNSTTESGEQTELVVMDLISGAGRSLGPIKGQTLQAPIWGLHTAQLYVASQNSTLQSSWLQRFDPASTDLSAKPLQTFSAYQGRFLISPDERYVLAGFYKTAGNRQPIDPNLTIPKPEQINYESAYSYSVIGNLETQEQTYFNAPIMNGFVSGVTNYLKSDQSVWDYRHQLNFSVYQAETLYQLDPAQKSQKAGLSLIKANQSLNDKLKLFLSDPGDFAFGTHSLEGSLEALVLAFSPRDSRMILGGFLPSQIPVGRFKLFHIWNPEQNQLIALDASFPELTSSYTSPPGL